VKSNWRSGSVGAVNEEGQPVEIILGADKLTFGSNYELDEVRSPAVHVSFSSTDVNQFAETIFGTYIVSFTSLSLRMSN